MSNNCFLLSIAGGTSGRRLEFFMNGLMVTVKSLRLTNPGTDIVISHSGLTAGQKDALEGCHLVEADASAFNPPHRRELTNAGFFKLYMDLYDGYDKVFYLDSDVVVLDDIGEVFALKGHIAARGRQRELSGDFREAGRVIRGENMREGQPLFNAGVICFDRNFWAREDMPGQAVSLVEKYGWENFKHLDQGLLNIIAHRYGGFTPLDKAYNYCRWNDMLDNGPFELKKNSIGLKAPYVYGQFIKVLHWNGPVKPWEFASKGLAENEKSRFYHECYRQFMEE